MYVQYSTMHHSATRWPPSTPVYLGLCTLTGVGVNRFLLQMAGGLLRPTFRSP